MMEGLAATRSERKMYESRQKREWHPTRWLVAAGVIVVLLAVGAWQVLTAPSVEGTTPLANSYIGSTDVPVSLTVKGLSALSDLKVSLDGHDITKTVKTSGDTLSFIAGGLSDGQHVVTLHAGTSNLYRRSVDQTLAFTVDTTPPRLHWISPKTGEIFDNQEVSVEGESDPGATVRLQDGSTTKTVRTGPDGRFTFAITLPDGRHKLELSATDKAGNTKSAKRRVAVNRFGPVLTIPTETELKTGSPTLSVTVTDPLGSAHLLITSDGDEVFSGQVKGTKDVKLADLAEGEHTIKYTATDKADKTTTRIQTVLVDSTDKLGQKVLQAGAVGNDVKELQQLLVDNKLYHYEPTGTYTPGTTAAVQRFQKRLGLPIDGKAGPDVIAALYGRIVVNQTQCKLYFYQRGTLKLTFSVATGMPAYPTPNGVFKVVVMAKNPTWIPPDSPWAKGLEPIPPGSGNPLGTRWIGTSASGVGIHGTPADYSIGTHASHGCIRMHIWDVEKLYDYVKVGMPVIIQP